MNISPSTSIFHRNHGVDFGLLAQYSPSTKLPALVLLHIAGLRFMYGSRLTCFWYLSRLSWMTLTVGSWYTVSNADFSSGISLIFSICFLMADIMLVECTPL